MLLGAQICVNGPFSIYHWVLCVMCTTVVSLVYGITCMHDARLCTNVLCYQLYCTVTVAIIHTHTFSDWYIMRSVCATCMHILT